MDLEEIGPAVMKSRFGISLCLMTSSIFVKPDITLLTHSACVFNAESMMNFRFLLNLSQEQWYVSHLRQSDQPN